MAFAAAVTARVDPRACAIASWVQFQAALAAIAETKGCSLSDVEAKVTAATGPSSSGTVAEAVKFHDDKSLYTVSPRGRRFPVKRFEQPSASWGHRPGQPVPFPKPSPEDLLPPDHGS